MCVSLIWGCEKSAEPAAEPAAKAVASAPASKTAPASKPASSDHGGETALGRVSVAGFEFEVAALGSIKAGSDAAVALKVLKAPDGRDWRSANVYLWVEDGAGKKLSAPEKGRVENARLHGHTSIPAKATGVPALVVIRVRDGETDARASVALAGGGAAAGGSVGQHTHDNTPHDGVVARLTTSEGGAEAGWIELKLHDDKGDLELWVTTDKAGKTPLDLPLDAKIVVTFVDHARRKVSLAPRNKNKNEGEDGKPNLRDGKTGYFIFPGETGADAAWLVGKTFQSVALVELKAGGRTLRSDEFVLKPHSHHHGAH
jgi:hypothetical protein